jgi:glycogen operon protein
MMRDEDWNAHDLRFVGVETRMAHSTPAYERRFDALYLAFNAGEDVRITLPDAPDDHFWRRVFDTSQPGELPPQGAALVLANSVAVFRMTRDAPRRARPSRRAKDSAPGAGRKAAPRSQDAP